MTRDAAGNVVDGSPDTVVDVTDVWTFARTLGSRDPELAARRDRSGAMNVAGAAALAASLLLGACARPRERPLPPAGRRRTPGSSRSPSRDLAGWDADDHARRFRDLPPELPGDRRRAPGAAAGAAAGRRPRCGSARAAPDAGRRRRAAEAFFEAHFRAVRGRAAVRAAAS